MKNLTVIVAVVAALVLIFPRAASAQSTFHTFDDFLTRHAAAQLPAERDSLLSQFWRQVLKEGIPWVDSTGRNVTFFYRGRADSVKVSGDFTSWMFKMNMRRLPETDLFFLRLSFEKDARFDYKLIVNGKAILDPLNKQTTSGRSGDNSELAMPRFIRTRELQEYATTLKGKLVGHTLANKAAGYEQKVHTYLPHNYDAEKGDYPVVYFLNGSDYMNFANAVTVLDNMMASKQIPPAIAVFVVPPTDSAYNYLSESYASFFAKELIPFIDRKYRTKQAGTQRLVIGDAHAGMISFYIGFSYPTVVTNVASQSGYLSSGNDTLLTVFGQSPAKPLRVYMDVGTYEKNVGAFPEESSEGNIYRANRNFRRLLDQKDYDVVYREFPDGHSWGRRRNELPFILRWFLARLTQ